MLSRPTTAQILEDCRRELSEVVAPALGDEAVAVSVAMLDEVLRNCAVRTAHEIAWMMDEIGAMTAYASEVADSVEENEAVIAALDTHQASMTESLHLDDVCAAYSTAGQCLSEALGAARSGGEVELLRQGRVLLDERVVREDEIKGDWGFVGRG
ncbi:MAG: hypothetical protein VX833_05355 [Actinomycetota bacterium]|nr:hypothetical protein [Actinomycetota bacterium]